MIIYGDVIVVTHVLLSGRKKNGWIVKKGGLEI